MIFSWSSYISGLIFQLTFQVYDGAVYMHQGKTYLVKELDISTKIALCQAADLKYYTKTRDYTDIHVIGGDIVCRLLLLYACNTSISCMSCALYESLIYIVGPVS